MNILISNDDGINAQGIKTLAAALREAGHRVTVIAPDRNRSAASSCLTLTEPLRVHQFDEFNYAVIAGTPADCVHLALNGLFPNDFDLVISGINHGANLGDDIVYSGTVAAALEGRHLPLPCLAVSLVGRKGDDKHHGHLFRNNHFETAAKVVLSLLPKLHKDLINPREILNINVPDLPYEKLNGVMITRQGKRSQAAEIVKSQDPRNGVIYWLGANGVAIDESEGTDFYAINNDYVSITPIQADMTAHRSLTDLQEII
ncbi:5'/3'-nucleotidase SurE [Actinobacillus porcitonsillarum]|uniref:5'-nucleotidase SurE n=1 Tax=Actinobacillus porcitonsillarum TaxID=189834 RepID=A0A2U8FGR3_9PAST|nr:5'/3'-nucleotidase SurE [Actinobacillus porcitonsillarum]AWI50171.1 5'/3'-nucleotidase SurE [Actinobacillus porcitonsillarum]